MEWEHLRLMILNENHTKTEFKRSAVCGWAFGLGLGPRGLGGLVQPHPIMIEHMRQPNGQFKIGGFYQEGVRSQAIGPVDVAHVARRGENDHTKVGEGRLLTNPLENLESVHAGHFQIQQQERWERVLDPVEILACAGNVTDGFFTIANEIERDAGTGLLEGFSDKDDVVLPVFGYQNERLVGCCKHNKLHNAISFARGRLFMGCSAQL